MIFLSSFIFWGNWNRQQLDWNQLYLINIRPFFSPKKHQNKKGSDRLVSALNSPNLLMTICEVKPSVQWKNNHEVQMKHGLTCNSSSRFDSFWGDHSEQKHGIFHEGFLHLLRQPDKFRAPAASVRWRRLYNQLPFYYWVPRAEKNPEILPSNRL